METIVFYFRWSISLILVFLGVWVILGNYVMIYKSIRTRKFHSLIPMFGAIFVLLAILVSPLTFRMYYLFIALLDPGTIVTIISIPVLIKAFISGR